MVLSCSKDAIYPPARHAGDARLRPTTHKTIPTSTNQVRNRRTCRPGVFPTTNESIIPLFFVQAHLVSVLPERRFQRGRADPEADSRLRVAEGRQEARRCPAQDQRVNRGLVRVPWKDHHAIAPASAAPRPAGAGAADGVRARARAVPPHARDDRRKNPARAAGPLASSAGCSRPRKGRQ